VRYLGGKSRQAKRIKQLILDKVDNRETYIEPFLGGASVASIIAPEFEKVLLSDLSEDLVLFWQAIQVGWVPPTELTKEEYANLKECEPSALRAWAGFAGSYCGKWFGGYGAVAGERNFLEESLKSTLRKSGGLSEAIITHRSYLDIKPEAGSVIYCDPPYADTTGYTATSGFDNQLFWKTVNGWAEHSFVFVSEYSGPSDWEVIHLTERFTTIGSVEAGQPSKKRQEFIFYKGPT